MMSYLAVGEAPIEIRNVFRQRSRWTKGHYQVFYSRHNPLINFDLPFFQRLLYAYATWSPFCTVITVPGVHRFLAWIWFCSEGFAGNCRFAVTCVTFAS
jgi:cellulose synthase/poly-beta-1,6-N-acetylglucosamine synthase-like glycosyltransferase